MIRIGWINSLLGSFLISLSCPCCFLQIFLSMFGIGSAGFATLLLPHRSLFMLLTVISLTYSYFRYRPSKLHFVLVVTLTLCLSFSSEILEVYHNQLPSYDRLYNNLVITHWQITGMHCESCRSVAIRSLQKINGVLSVNVDLNSGHTDLITQMAIADNITIQAVQSAGFQVYKII